MTDPMDLVRINLKGAEILLLQSTTQGLDILSQILTGFGAKQFHRCVTAEEAKGITEKQTLDLLIVEGQLGDRTTDGFDFVRWLRRSPLEPNAWAPILMVSGHCSVRNVQKARDCGANFVVAKPVIPTVLWERLLWIARENRPFVKAGDIYVGPERRFKNEGPPNGMAGRRSTDLSAEVGEATLPNMNQEDIDSLLQPKRVNI